MRTILVIAGSDSSGGAGIEADQKVIAAHGCYAMTATTALTVQNTQGVYGIHITPSDFVRRQIQACMDDIGADAVKIGMLASAETVEAVANTFHQYGISNSVVDPVMVSTSGSQLLHEDAVRSLRERLLPKTMLLTPNIPEARLLLQNAGKSVKEPGSVDDMIDLAKSIEELGPTYVLLKGGHMPFNTDESVEGAEGKRYVADILVGPHGTTVMKTDFLESKNTHGTGCSLASAIASNLARGVDIIRAVKLACQFVEAGIKTSVQMGRGHGPINHFHSTYSLPFAYGHFFEYLLDHSDIKSLWERHVDHPFVRRLGDATLPIADFRLFLIQDYLYLVQFARLYALAGSKSKSIDQITASCETVMHIRREMNLHIEFCKEFGIREEEIARQEERPACMAYTRYLLDIGHSEDGFALQLASAACILGYAAIARRLDGTTSTLRGGDNRYWKWIEMYISEDYIESVSVIQEAIEKQAVKQSASRIEEIVQIFVQAIKLEIGMWDMAYSGHS